MPKIDWANLSVEEVIYYYAFSFDFDISLVLSLSLTELEEMVATKVAIENWKNSD